MTSYRSMRSCLWLVLLVALGGALVSLMALVQWESSAQADEQGGHGHQIGREALIVGGTEVSNGKYPFMAYIELYRNGKFYTSCGGTLLDQNSVLTAAHCLINTTGAHVIVGRTDLRQKKQGQARWASRPFIHPRYLGNGYDAAVLKLKRPVKGIKPIKLATAKQNYLEKPGHILRAAGWGSVRSKPKSVEDYPKRMREVSIPVVSDSRAKQAYQSQDIKYLPSLNVAAGKKGKSPCYGDSGGPLFDAGSRTQVGIDSYSAKQKCARARYPEVFTEVNNPDIRNFILWAAKR